MKNHGLYLLPSAQISKSRQSHHNDLPICWVTCTLHGCFVQSGGVLESYPGIAQWGHVHITWAVLSNQERTYERVSRMAPCIKALLQNYVTDITMTSLWHHYDITDISMTSLWHLYVTSMTSLWHHWHLYDISDITMTSLWHLYDITDISDISDISRHLYDITMTSLWHLYDITVITVTSLWHHYDITLLIHSYQSRRGQHPHQSCWAGCTAVLSAGAGGEIAALTK